jgi:hypothetical protein
MFRLPAIHTNGGEVKADTEKPSQKRDLKRGDDNSPEIASGRPVEVGFSGIALRLDIGMLGDPLLDIADDVGDGINLREIISEI